MAARAALMYFLSLSLYRKARPSTAGIQGREFLFVFTPNYNDWDAFPTTSDTTDFYYVSPVGLKNTRVMLSYLAFGVNGPTATPLLATPNSPIRLQMAFVRTNRVNPNDPCFTCTGPNKEMCLISAKAATIIAEDDVVVQVASVEWRSASAITVFPIESLGRDYYVYLPSRDDFYACITIISTVDNNQITVTLPPAAAAGPLIRRREYMRDIGNYQDSFDVYPCSSAPVSVTCGGRTFGCNQQLSTRLNRSQAWLLVNSPYGKPLQKWNFDAFVTTCNSPSSDQGSISDFSGTRVTSTKEIAVQVSSTKGYSGSWGFTADKVEELLQPTEVWGKEYPFPRTPDRWTVPDTIAVIAKEDGTQVKIWNATSGTTSTDTLISGVPLRRWSGFLHDTGRLRANERDWIKSDKPIMVVAITSGSDHMYFHHREYYTAGEIVVSNVSLEWANSDPYDAAMVIAVSLSHFTNDAVFATFGFPDMSADQAYTHCMVILMDAHKDGLLVNEMSIQQFAAQGNNVTYKRFSFPGNAKASGYGSYVLRRLADGFPITRSWIALPRVFRLRHRLPHVTFAAYSYGGQNQDGHYSVIGARWWPHNLPCVRQATPPDPLTSDDLDNDCDGLVNEEMCYGIFALADEDGDGLFDEDCAAQSAGLPCQTTAACRNISYAWVCNPNTNLCECDSAIYMTDQVTGTCVKYGASCVSDADCNVTDTPSGTTQNPAVGCVITAGVRACKCKDGYTLSANKRCIGSDRCAGVRCQGGTSCFVTGSGYVCKDPTMNMKSTLTIQCSAEKDCQYLNYATCNPNGYCTCEADFQANSDGTTCVYAPQAVKCSSDINCLRLKGGWACTNGLTVNYCVCRPGFVLLLSGECVLSPNQCFPTECTANSHCSAANSYCGAGYCCCNSGYRANQGSQSCIQEAANNMIINYCPFCNPCNEATGCLSVPNAVCLPSLSKCACRNGYYLLGNATCKRDRYDGCLSKPCPTGQYCVDGQHDSGYTCVTPKDRRIEGRWVGKKCPDGCSTGTTCLTDIQICACAVNYEFVGGKCTLRATSFCSAEDPHMFSYSTSYYTGACRALRSCTTNSDCDPMPNGKCSSNYKCVCRSGYTEVTANRCYRIETCLYSTTSVGGRWCDSLLQTCDDFGFCQCYAGAIRTANDACNWDPQTVCTGCKANWACVSDADCFGTKLYCNQAKICACREGYVLNPEKTGCVENPNAVAATTQCAATSGCSSISNSYCHTVTLKCTCHQNHCLVGNQCQEDVDDCLKALCPTGTVCVDRPCNSQYVCVALVLATLRRNYDNVSCNTNSDCVNSLDDTTQCDTARKGCICTGSLVVPYIRAPGMKFCVGPPDDCSSDADCQGSDINSFCSASRCQCKPGTKLNTLLKCTVIIVAPPPATQPPTTEATTSTTSSTRTTNASTTTATSIFGAASTASSTVAISTTTATSASVATVPTETTWLLVEETTQLAFRMISTTDVTVHTGLYLFVGLALVMLLLAGIATLVLVRRRRRDRNKRVRVKLKAQQAETGASPEVPPATPTPLPAPLAPHAGSQGHDSSIYDSASPSSATSSLHGGSKSSGSAAGGHSIKSKGHRRSHSPGGHTHSSAEKHKNGGYYHPPGYYTHPESIAPSVKGNHAHSAASGASGHSASLPPAHHTTALRVKMEPLLNVS